MQMHSETWGHVALATPSTEAMNIAEEAQEICMMRCRYGKKSSDRFSHLCGYKPETSEVIFNPNTLKDLAHIFGISVERAFDNA